MRISSEHIEKLRSYGLFVAKPRSSDSCYPDGVLVGKPDNVLGNHIEAYSAGYSTAVAVGQEVRFDAPPVWFFGHHGVWFVLAEDYCPGPGPGDFLDEWSTPEEAVEDILDFYFGDPARMQAKAEARKKPSFSPDKDDNSVNSLSA